MAIITPPTIDPVPTPIPQRGDPDTFGDRYDAKIRWDQTAQPQFQAVATNVYNNATEAYNQALASAASAADAQTAANSATVTANITKWVSGTTYADGQVTWSPINGLPYRRMGAGGGTTDPSLDGANWVIQLLGQGLGGTTIVGSVTLTKSSAAAMVVTPAGPGLYVTLPDATTLTLGALQFTISNVGDYDYGVKDSAGNVLGWVWPGKAAVLGLSDKSTAAGVWSAADLQKIGVTALFAAPTISSSDNNLVVLPVDATRTLVLFGNLYATMYDSSTLAWASPVTVRLNTTYCSAGLSGTNQALVVSVNGTSGEAVTISLGASLTVNTANKATFSLPTSVSRITPTLTPVGASWVVGITGSAAAYVAAITVSGNAPTVGATTAVASVANLPVIIAAGTVARVFGLDVSAAYAKPYSVSGVTLSAGTSASDTASGADNVFRVAQLGSGNVLVVSANGADIRALLFKLTGTTEGVSAINMPGMPGTSVTNSDVLSISSTKMLVALADSASTQNYANIITDTSGVASAGTAYSVTSSTVSTCSALQIVGTTARVAYYNGSEVQQVVFDCSGASPSVVSRHIANPQIAQPVKSDQYGRRNYAKLTAGSAAYVMANGTKADGRYAVGGVQMLPPLPINFSNGAAGASANESWGLDRSQAVGGKVIKRIEVCA